MTRPTRAEALAIARAAVWVAVAEIGLRTLSLGSLARWLGVTIGAARSVSPVPPAVALENAADLLFVRAVDRVLARWPFARGGCLRRAIVLARHARSRRPEIRFGAFVREGALHAHAWVEIEGAAAFGGRPCAPLVSAADRGRRESCG